MAIDVLATIFLLCCVRAVKEVLPVGRVDSEALNSTAHGRSDRIVWSPWPGLLASTNNVDYV